MSLKHLLKYQISQKSIDFWSQGIAEGVTLTFYFRQNKDNRIKYEFTNNNIDVNWHRYFINFTNSNIVSNYSQDLYLIRIRVSFNSNKLNSPLLIDLSDLYVNNYVRDDNNIYSDTLNVLEDFNSGSPDNFIYLQNGIEFDKSEISTVENNEEVNVKWSGKSFLNIHCSKSSDNPLLLIFSQCYKIPQDKLISLFIKGNGGNERISFILQEGKDRYYELELTKITSKEWKRCLVRLPSDEITYYYDDKTNDYFNKLIGIKISQSNNNSTSPINIGIDELAISSDFTKYYK